MQDAELLAKDPPDNQQRFDQDGQVGEVLDKLLDARLELGGPHHADLETEVAQRPAQVIVDSNGLRLQKLAIHWITSSAQTFAKTPCCRCDPRPPPVIYHAL